MASGNQLGVDLNQLYRTAHYLSRVADDFNQAATLAGTQPPAASGPWPTTVQEWALLQYEVCDVLSSTSKDLGDIATPLNDTTNNYAATDQAAADELRQLQQTVDVNEQGWSN
jgi:hypothetical protein